MGRLGSGLGAERWNDWERIYEFKNASMSIKR